MYDGTIKWCVPVEVIGAQRADRPNNADGGVLEDGGEASDSTFGDGFKDNCRLAEASLRAAAVGAVGDLHTVGWTIIEAGVGNFFAGEEAVDWLREIWATYTHRIIRVGLEESEVNKNSSAGSDKNKE